MTGDCTKKKHNGCCCEHGRENTAACEPCEINKLRLIIGDAADKLELIGWKLVEPPEARWAVRAVLTYDPAPRVDWEPLFRIKES